MFRSRSTRETSERNKRIQKDTKGTAQSIGEMVSSSCSLFSRNCTVSSTCNRKSSKRRSDGERGRRGRWPLLGPALLSWGLHFTLPNAECHGPWRDSCLGAFLAFSVKGILELLKHRPKTPASERFVSQAICRFRPSSCLGGPVTSYSKQLQKHRSVI